jgi:hypothetical protein
MKFLVEAGTESKSQPKRILSRKFFTTKAVAVAHAKAITAEGRHDFWTLSVKKNGTFVEVFSFPQKV